MRLCLGSNTFSRLATLGIALHRRGESLPAGGSSGADGAVARLSAMPSKDRATYDPPEKSGGEGWLVSAEQQLLCQFKPDAATAHAQWVAVRTYSWVPPRPPVPQTRRRMLRHNAIEAWETMLKTGWRRCSPPVR